jgi:hypothetical protein
MASPFYPFFIPSTSNYEIPEKVFTAKKKRKYALFKKIYWFFPHPKKGLLYSSPL